MGVMMGRKGARGPVAGTARQDLHPSTLIADPNLRSAPNRGNPRHNGLRVTSPARFGPATGHNDPPVKILPRARSRTLWPSRWQPDVAWQTTRTARGVRSGPVEGLASPGRRHDGSWRAVGSGHEEARRSPGLGGTSERSVGQPPAARHCFAVSPRVPMTDRQYLPALGGSRWARAQVVRLP